MKNYIYESMWTQELEDLIENDKAKPLIMEMFYKHGFRVYQVIKQSVGGLNDDERFINKFMLTLDGLPYCQVYVDNMTDNTNYCFCSPFYEKERGRDRMDKSTIQSSKISGLMRMLDKYKCVVDTPERVIGTDAIYYIPATVERELLKDEPRGKPDCTNTEQYEVLKAYMTSTKLPEDKHTAMKNMFDKWTKTMETERHAVEKVQSMFGKDFYILGETSCEGICVGKARIMYKDSTSLRNVPYEITDSFQRVKSLDELEGHDDLKAAVVMYKVWMESNLSPHYQIKNKTLCNEIGYINELDVVSSGTHRGYMFEPFNINLLAIPIETE